MAILSCHVSIKLPPKISDGQGTCSRMLVRWDRTSTDYTRIAERSFG